MTDCHNACDCKGNTWLNKAGVCVAKRKCTVEDVEATEISVAARDTIASPEDEETNGPANGDAKQNATAE